MSRLQAWMGERDSIARDLRALADSMAAATPWAAVAPGMPPTIDPATARGPAAARKAKKRRTMSAEARAKIAAAQKARWAAQKEGGASRKAEKAKKAKSA
jgi:hypothetical protein